MFGRKIKEKDNEIIRLQTELSESIKRQDYLKSILFNGIEGYINAVYVKPEPPVLLFQKSSDLMVLYQIIGKIAFRVPSGIPVSDDTYSETMRVYFLSHEDYAPFSSNTMRK